MVVQVRTCTTGQVPLLLSTKVNVGLASHASVAVAVAKLGVAGQSIVLAAGKAAIAGGVMSRTLDVKSAGLGKRVELSGRRVIKKKKGQVPVLRAAKGNGGTA